jgi:hypothetical protein
MSDETNSDTDVMPSATANEAEIAAWNGLSRDQQLHRYREVLANPACDTITNDSMSDILTVARRRVAARRHA